MSTVRLKNFGGELTEFQMEHGEGNGKKLLEQDEAP
jgi:hypothetical protein